MFEAATRQLSCKAALLVASATRRMKRALAASAEESGQGTTEYAILVGVLVVIAIVAVTSFRGKIQELWTLIAEGVNGL